MNNYLVEKEDNTLSTKTGKNFIDNVRFYPKTNSLILLQFHSKTTVTGYIIC